MRTQATWTRRNVCSPPMNGWSRPGSASGSPAGTRPRGTWRSPKAASRMRSPPTSGGARRAAVTCVGCSRTPKCSNGAGTLTRRWPAMRHSRAPVCRTGSASTRSYSPPPTSGWASCTRRGTTARRRSRPTRGWSISGRALTPSSSPCGATSGRGSRGSPPSAEPSPAPPGRATGPGHEGGGAAGRGGAAPRCDARSPDEPGPTGRTPRALGSTHRLELADERPARIGARHEYHIQRAVLQARARSQLGELALHLLGIDGVQPAGDRVHGEADESPEHDVPPHRTTGVPGGRELVGLVAGHGDGDRVHVLARHLGGARRSAFDSTPRASQRRRTRLAGVVARADAGSPASAGPAGTHPARGSPHDEVAAQSTAPPHSSAACRATGERPTGVDDRGGDPPGVAERHGAAPRRGYAMSKSDGKGPDAARGQPGEDRRETERRRIYNRRSGVDRRFEDEAAGKERRAKPERRSGRDRRAWVERRKKPGR